MKIVRFAAGGSAKYGLLRDETIAAIRGRPFHNIKLTGEFHRLKQVRLLAPCRPSKIVALGLNYRRHVGELNMSLPNAPLIFLKPSTAVIGPDDRIVYPSASARVDYEGELAVVIKRLAKRVAVKDAPEYVLGYTCFNDVTARDIQEHDKQWTRAKSFDTFAAIGPWIETELDPGNVIVETYLNGELKQRDNTSDLIYPVPELVSFISGIMTLLPGDVIATGTPSGVGPMHPGDTVEVRITAIGTLRNFIVKEA
jgi:2-keto-4-pentenoate hydratase/2-oxohepta-3-ene-1,7-dioic acid hydratase in catechol pathway